MADPRRVQFARLAAVIISGLLACAPALLALTEPIQADVTNKAITGTAKIAVFFWCLGWLVAFAWFRRTVGARIVWTFGCLTCLLHIAVAFHLGHGWSHEAAWEHTKQLGGYGDGIYVNYAFALVWLADVIWMWAAFDCYQSRPRWLHWTIHGFIGFVVFNAAVVFGSWQSRGSFFVWFVLYPLVLLLVARYLLRKTSRLAPAEQTQSPQ